MNAARTILPAMACCVRGDGLNRASDHGASTVEYAILVSLIAAIVVGVVVTLGLQTSDLFQTMQGLF